MQQLPSLPAMEILAISDQPVFESLMLHIGLPIVGRVEEDPLETKISEDTIAAVATEITEGVDDFVEVDRRLFEYKEVAEDYGYIVSFADPIT